MLPCYNYTLKNAQCQTSAITFYCRMKNFFIKTDGRIAAGLIFAQPLPFYCEKVVPPSSAEAPPSSVPNNKAIKMTSFKLFHSDLP